MKLIHIAIYACMLWVLILGPIALLFDHMTAIYQVALGMLTMFIPTLIILITIDLILYRSARDK